MVENTFRGRYNKSGILDIFPLKPKRKETMKNPIWFGKYQIIKGLGKGGSGEVYLARHIKLSSLCAIKRINKGHTLHEQLLHEAVILKNLSHPCIPVIFDFEEDEEYSYIIEQYMEGILLKDYLKKEGRLKEAFILSIGISICDLFLYLYSINDPVLYLDLNPGNIILKDNTVKLIDFGACVYKNNAEARKFSLGARGFAAPELNTKAAPDERSDVYAIAALLKAMIMGDGYNHKENKGDRTAEKLYSRELLRILQKSMGHQSILRYPTVAMLKKKLTEQNRRYKSGKVISRDSFTVAVGGVHNRTGTTHLAFLLNSYLNSLGVKSIYIERNTSGHLTEFLNREGAKLQSDGIWRLKGNSYLTGAGLATIPEIINYKVVISDYGVIELDKAEMWEAGLKLITAGGKVWETESIKQVLPELGRPSVKVLLNYLNGKQFRDFLKNFDEGNFIRIPYEPDPFNPSLADEMKDFLDGLIEEL